MSALLPLLRQRLRRDAVQLAIWIGSTVSLAAVGLPTVIGTYGDQQERAALLATVMANPVILLFRGLPSGAGEAQLVAFMMLPWLLLLTALMNSFLAVRHSRGDEEDGRLQLVASTPAGRWMPLLATVLHGKIAAVITGVLVAAVLIAQGAPLLGSVLMGASCVLVGIVFLCVGLVAAEVMPTSRAANAAGVWIVLGALALAGIGNALGTPSNDLTRMTSSALAWVSPFGWAENIRPYDADTVWPLVLTAFAAAALFGLCAVLHARRDLGSSFLPERQGRPFARAALASHLALVVRQSRSAVIGWIVAGLLVGVMSTSLASLASQFGAGNPAVTTLLQALSGTSADLVRGLVVVFFVMLGIFAACAATQTALRARQDETHGMAEVVLSSAVTRQRWLADHVTVAVGAATLTIVAGFAGAVCGSLVASDRGTLIRDAAVAGAGQLVASWVFAGLAALAVVILPRLAIPVAWALVAAASGVALFGPLYGLSTAVVDASPFAVAPIPSSGSVDIRGLVPLILVTVLTIGAALAAMRRRQLTN